MKCNICDNQELILLHDFGTAPVAGYLVSSLQQALSEIRFSNQLLYCQKCGLVQQSNDSFKDALIEKVYSNYRPTYSMSTKVQEYMSRFIDEAVRFCGTSKGIALEIGSNDGTMFPLLHSRGFRPAGIDPSASETTFKDSIVIKDFFCKRVATDFVKQYGKVPLLFSRHTLEHVFDPVDFMEAVSIVLSDNGAAVIEVPYLPAQVSNCQFAGMGFQHVSYFSSLSMRNLVRSCDLELSDAKPSKMDGGSIIFFLKKGSQGKGEGSSFVRGSLELEAASGFSDGKGLEEKFKNIGKMISLTKEHILSLKKKAIDVVAYGAGGKGQAILNMIGLSHDIIQYVVDDTPGSRGMFIPGVGTEVVDSSNGALSNAKIIFITAPTHVDEVVAKEYNKHPQASFLQTSPFLGYVSNF